MAEEDEYFEVEKTEEKIVILDEIRQLAAKEKVIESFPFCIGCGSLLGLKIALQELNPQVVIATGHIALLGKYPRLSLKIPLLNATNPSAAARILSKNYNVLIFAGDGTTNKTLDTIKECAKRNDNILYICNNNGSYSSSDFGMSLADKIEASYVASASVGFLADYIKKLKNTKNIQGFKFIDLFSPCPASWNFDPSMTIDIAKIAVNTNFWPLFEIIAGKKQMTFRPALLERIERYLEMQDRYKNLQENEIQKIKEIVDNNSSFL